MDPHEEEGASPHSTPVAVFRSNCPSFPFVGRAGCAPMSDREMSAVPSKSAAPIFLAVESFSAESTTPSSSRS